MLGVWGICAADVLPPLTTPAPSDQQAIRHEFERWLADMEV